MTPAEQRRLPLLVLDDDLIGDRRGILSDLVLPVLASARSRPEDATLHIARNVPGVRISLDATSQVGGVPVRAEIHVTAHSMDTIAPHGRRVDGDDPTTRALCAVHHLVSAILAVPTILVPERTPSSMDVMLSALRMRDAVGAPHEEEMSIDLHHATPLGTGGASVREAPYGTGGDRTIGHLVDLSPEVCMPGHVNVDVRRSAPGSSGTVRVEVVIDARIRRQRLSAPDPIVRMRAEAERPWDPSRMMRLPAE